MFQKVIWATDGSDAADQALSQARTLAAEGSGDLLVVHCEEWLSGRGGAFPVHVDEDELKAKINRQVAELSTDGVTARLTSTRSRAGGAVQAIADAAEREHADLIVVGTRGQTPIAGLLLGSVTQRLLHIAPCPVLAVPPSNGASV
jgi:nucleotide-binding universal stress UspA family protein